MKKVILIILAVVFAITLSCYFSAPRENGNDPSVMDDATAVAQDRDAIEIGYAEGDSFDYVSQNVTLPITGVRGTTISWSSNKTSNIKNSGEVIRPTFGATNVDVTLTATITRAGATTTKDFTLSVMAQSSICAATSLGLSVSGDGGVSWTKYDSSTPNFGGSTVYGVYSTGSSIYAATNSGISISTDTGTTWQTYKQADGLGSDTVNGVYYADSKIYAATAKGLSIYDRGWTNYTAAKNNLGSDTVNAVKVTVDNIPTKVTTIYAATAGGLSVSSNGGTSWTTYTTANGLGSNIVNSVKVTGLLKIITVYAATSNGLSVLKSGTWTNYTAESNGLSNNLVNDVGYGNSTIYAATNNGLSYSTNGGTSWFLFNTGASPQVNDIYVLGPKIIASTNNGLAISLDYGAKWDVYTTTLPSGPTHIASNVVNAVSAK